RLAAKHVQHAQSGGINGHVVASRAIEAAPEQVDLQVPASMRHHARGQHEARCVVDSAHVVCPGAGRKRAQVNLRVVCIRLRKRRSGYRDEGEGGDRSNGHVSAGLRSFKGQDEPKASPKTLPSMRTVRHFLVAPSLMLWSVFAQAVCVRTSALGQRSRRKHGRLRGKRSKGRPSMNFVYRAIWPTSRDASGVAAGIPGTAKSGERTLM